MVGGEAGTSKPALGESWKSIPHARLLLSRNYSTNDSIITILKHPYLVSILPYSLLTADIYHSYINVFLTALTLVTSPASLFFNKILLMWLKLGGSIVQENYKLQILLLGTRLSLLNALVLHLLPQQDDTFLYNPFSFDPSHQNFPMALASSSRISENQIWEML